MAKYMHFANSDNESDSNNDSKKPIGFPADDQRERPLKLAATYNFVLPRFSVRSSRKGDCQGGRTVLSIIRRETVITDGTN